MPHPFVRATTWQRDSGSPRGALRFTEDWYQGRGAYGGVVAGALARAMAEVDQGPSRPLRWFTVHFCAPAVGDAQLTVEPQRSGHAVTHTTARIDGAGGVIATASATFARDRPGQLSWAPAEPPAARDPDAITPFEGAPTPVFASHLEYRFAHGARPLSGAPIAEIGLWLRFREPLLLDEPAAIALLDAAPPAAMARMTEPRPMASVAFAAQLYSQLPLAAARPDDHYLLTVRSRVAGGGYCEEAAELWTRDRQLIAACWQHIALLG
ncbi:MAG: thioesterase family protein [Nannocystis sp.]|nr:thioesterase family protein [Nannocystis sp.]